MATSDLIAKWARQAKMRILSASFRNMIEARIFIEKVGENYISCQNTRSGIIVKYFG
jgi:hypothetical protein